MGKIPLIGYTENELKAYFESLGARSFYARQVLTWLYRKRMRNIEAMTDLPKSLRKELENAFHTELLQPADVAMDEDDRSAKLLFHFQNIVYETALIPDQDRFTVCLSLQSGCKYGCRFCATGALGFRGHLDTYHIIQQVYHAYEIADVTNIVYMGMGEPLDNVENVFRSLTILTSEWGFAFPARKITVSTIGLMPQLQQLIDQTKVNIAISIHSPFHDERKELMPVEHVQPIEEVLSAVIWRNWPRTRRLTFEYILFKGVNDSYAHAKKLATLSRKYNARINLIRYNDIYGIHQLEGSSQQQILQFEAWLRNMQVPVTLRKSKGRKIHAACGMLAAHKT